MLQKRFRSIRAAQRRGIGIVALGASVLALIAAPACNEALDPGPSDPQFNVGVIQGRVRVAGRDTAIAVGVRRLDYPGTIVAKTVSDASGWYRLAMPPGRYHIDLLPDSHGFSDNDARDTVRVVAGIRRLDVFRGALTVRLSVPPIANGQHFNCVLDPEPPQHSSANATAHDGSVQFNFPIVDPATYRMRIDLGSYDFQHWLPGTRDKQAADQVVVSTLHSTLYDKPFRDYASISGSLRGSWQEADVRPPEVVAFSLASEPVARANVGSNGSFTLALLDVEPCRLSVEITGIQRWIGGDTFETATTFHPHRGDHLTGISAVDGGILCTLIGPGSLARHHAVAVLRDAQGNTFTTDSGRNDPLAICNLRRGFYKLYVHADCSWGTEGWGSQWYGGSDAIGTATAVEVVEGQVTHVTIPLESDGAIVGRILNAAGAPASGYVSLYHSGFAWCSPRYTGIDSFVLRGLGDGDYTVAVGYHDHPWWYPGTATPDSAQVISVRNHATMRGIEWRLPPAGLGEQP